LRREKTTIDIARNITPRGVCEFAWLFGLVNVLIAVNLDEARKRLTMRLSGVYHLPDPLRSALLNETITCTCLCEAGPRSF